MYMHAVLIVLHVLLCWGDYAFGVLCFFGFQDLEGWQQSWSDSGSLLWYIFMFAFGNFVALYITIHILKSDHQNQELPAAKLVLKAFEDLQIVGAFSLQLSCLVLYFTAYYIQFYTLLTGSDVKFNATYAITNHVEIWHAMISCFSYDYFSVTLARVKEEKSKRKFTTPKKSLRQHIKALTPTSLVPMLSRAPSRSTSAAVSTKDPPRSQ
ncbi:hypothetical protein HDU91_003900 [Kappamyces sp. JEL0680]|nr:hypothetical protein HDU91_003900 [Kappamyces sp. JEL0680]